MVRAASRRPGAARRQLLAPFAASISPRARHALSVQAQGASQRDRGLRLLRGVHDPARLAAWETFGVANGVRDLDQLRRRLARVKVLDAYDRACAVTQEHSLPVLEAAHIRPYAEGGEHSVANGLSLRSDLHRLFDRGYVTVDEDHRFVVSDRKQLLLPSEPALRPDPAALDWHRSQAFLG